MDRISLGAVKAGIHMETHQFSESFFHGQYLIDHYAVVCSVTWPLNGSEAGVDFDFI